MNTMDKIIRKIEDGESKKIKSEMQKELYYFFKCCVGNQKK